MLMYPEIQRKAQAEVDRVVGRDRLPDFSDEPSLPYVTALVKEVLRSVCYMTSGIPACMFTTLVSDGDRLLPSVGGPLVPLPWLRD